MSETNLTAALAQINKLQTELIQTDQLIKDALLDYVPENVKALLNTLIGFSIPHLLLEIGHLLKTANFDCIDEKQIPDHFFPIEIKEEMIIEDIKEEEVYTPEHSHGFEEPVISNETAEPQIATKSTVNKFIIEGSSGDERTKSLETFVGICLQLSGTKAALLKHKNHEKGFMCPHCLSPTDILNCHKASSFLRHIVRFHEDSPLIPLPFLKAPIVKPKKSQIEANKIAAATITSLSQNAKGQYLLTGKNFQEKHRRLSLFVSLCLKCEGAAERISEYKKEYGNYACPHCPPEKSVTMALAQPSKFMIHLVRNHEDSELIPLPFLREATGVKGREETNDQEIQGPFVIRDRTSFDQFLTRCLNVPGVRDNFTHTYYKEGDDGKKGFACPHCHPNRRLTLCKIRDFMRHLVPVHPTSELIPLPFVREGTLSRKRKREENEESASNVDDNKIENGANLTSSESEFILGLD